MTPKSVLVTLDPGPSLARFHHDPGQRITLCVPRDGDTCFRSYNLINEPGDLPQVAVKHVTDGGGSHWINAQVQPGDVLEVIPPSGSLYEERLDHTAHHFLLIAAGSGITPLYSIARHALRARPDHRITLIYANSTARDIMMQEAIDRLADSPRMEVFHILRDGATGEDLSSGRLDQSKLTRLLEQFRRRDMPERAFLSGPIGFMQVVQDTVSRLEQPMGLVQCSFLVQPYRHPDDHRSEQATSTVTVTLNGQTRTLDEVRRNRTLLEAADDAGLAMPANCRSGICHRCKARLISGHTHAIPGSTVSRKVEDGWILCCQQRPASERVEIELK